MIKRIIDLCLCLPALLVLLPVWMIIVLLIRVTSPGPAIFKQTRAGKNGTPFTFYKFRTMRTDVDPYGASPKSGKDPRLTRIGVFLRETSLDELPQLFNIIMGDMSIVGPRPLYIEQMAEWDERQKRRLQVRPGLTGLAQVSGRGELTREEKLELDVRYVETVSLRVDVKIICDTIAQVFGRQSIYEKQYSQTEVTRGASLNEDTKETVCQQSIK